MMRYLWISRGWSRRLAMTLVGCVVAAWVLGNVTIHLRTAADLDLASPVLDRGILVGLALPVVCLVRALEDRLAWLLVSAARPRALLRLVYVVAISSLGLVVGLFLAVATPGQESRVLIFADLVLLLGLGITTSVLTGAHLAWILPVGLALTCSTPGLVPLSVNILVRADAAPTVLVCGGLSLALGITLFASFDDYRIRRSLLLARTAGVTDE